ncbi:uncharacterized protein LOC116192264 [Punica granatum]|uniref:Uncharacterized protein LOC116192264 n=1 Tax=Punica granatum TaxID=22663 RepID=A0A6P8BZN0_PUNGR|nr:uncharacterized protein LOC116192264 [Punica granatum]
MGNLISQAANGIGDALGSAFSAPFKSVFGASCEEVCSGPWDVVCFIEHLCVANLAKFLLIVGLCYMILLFFFLLFKLGICQCIGRSLCKMCWAACVTYWYAVGDISCFLCHRLMSTKRVYRRRRRYRDLEVGYQSSTDEETNFSSHHRHSSASKKRKSLGESAGVRSPAYPSSRHGRHSSHSRRHHRMKLRRKQVSFRVKGRAQRLKSLRHHRRVGSMHHHHRRESKSFKRQRLGC